uniref:RIIa domain-containing protein n=1 Tax=Stegastes partitus TaxID=144197 RepID=A0A3B5ADB9_9TELE
MMSASRSIPYGFRSLLECLARAALLAQPDNLEQFMCTHITNMVRSRVEDCNDPKEVAFSHQEQWERMILKPPPPEAHGALNVCILGDTLSR